MEHISPGPSCAIFKISRQIRYRVLYSRVRLLAFGAHLARPVVCSLQSERIHEPEGTSQQPAARIQELCSFTWTRFESTSWEAESVNPFVRNTHADADRRAVNGRAELAGAQGVNRSSERRCKMQTLLPNHGPCVRHHRPNIDQARNKLARCDVQPFDRNGIGNANPRAERRRRLGTRN